MKIWPGIIAAALLAGCQNPQQDTLVDRGAYQLETLHQAQGADQRIRFLVMHYTAEDFHSSLKTLTDEHVSAHYLLPAHPQREHGKPTVFRLVPEAMRAWHAGASAWRGRSNLNDTSIGIEIVNKGFTRSMLFTHWQPYTAEQIAVLIPLSRDIIQRYGIQPQDVVGHSDIAPQRKQDPGPLFPYRRLAGRTRRAAFAGGARSPCAGTDGAAARKAGALRLRDRPVVECAAAAQCAGGVSDALPARRCARRTGCGE